GDPTFPIVGVRSGSNPGGPGHSTVKMQFIDPAPLGWERVPMLTVEGAELNLGNGMTPDAMFIPSKSSDRPAGQAADPTYVPRLNLLSPSLRAAYRDGDWSRFEGMRFERFDPRLHIADPRDWPIEDLLAYPRALGIDYGSSAPFAAIWMAR